MQLIRIYNNDKLCGQPCDNWLIAIPVIELIIWRLSTTVLLFLFCFYELMTNAIKKLCYLIKFWLSLIDSHRQFTIRRSSDLSQEKGEALKYDRKQCVSIAINPFSMRIQQFIDTIKLTIHNVHNVHLHVSARSLMPAPPLAFGNNVDHNLLLNIKEFLHWYTFTFNWLEYLVAHTHPIKIMIRMVIRNISRIISILALIELWK